MGFICIPEAFSPEVSPGRAPFLIARGCTGMNLVDLLTKKQAVILERWFQWLLETYPAETARFMREEKNRFANPVGSSVYQGIEGLCQELLQGMEPDRVYPFLDTIVRIRAVQDFPPSRAVAFIFALKKVILEELESEIRGGQISVEELLEFESRIDNLALFSFDIYTQCREKVSQIRIDEIKKRSERLLRRASLVVDLSE